MTPRVQADARTPASAAGTSPDAIVTEGLTKVFGGRGDRVTAVDGVDLAIGRGELFGLLGPNGAGKTTTIGMLTTRVVPTAGLASVEGVDVAAHPVEVKQRIGVVPQTNTLDRSVSVRENLYYHGRYFGLSRRASWARTDEALQRFQLADRAEAMVDTLSGGMAQRLMIARALLHRPGVLFLDEPTTGLDPQARIALWDQLRALHTAGQTVLLTTHYMAEAEQLCDRLAIMDHGRILALGTPRALVEAIDTDSVVHVSVDGDPHETELERLAGGLLAVDGVQRGDVVEGVVRLYATSSKGLLPRVVLQAERLGVSVSEISVADPTLETVFIELTGRALRE